MSPWKRKEQIGDCTLYLGDCLDILPVLGKVDAVVTDPPYGISVNTKTKSSARVGDATKRHGGQPKLRDFEEVHGDDKPFDPRPFLDFNRVVLFGANHFSHRLPPASMWMIWDKRNGGTSDDNADCEIAWTNLKGPARLFSHLWRGMVRASENGTSRVHPTQKPIELMKWCLGFLPDSEIILDPFMGSGSTGVACVKTGRSFIGIELHEPYFDIACRRIADACARPDLFIQAEKAAVKAQQIALFGEGGDA